MRETLSKKETIAVMILQALICRREILRPSPSQAARLARTYTDFLMNEFNASERNNLYFLERHKKKI